MLSRRCSISAAALLVTMLLAVTSTSAANPAAIIPAFTKAHPGNHLSPDGKYVARLVSGEGEAGEMTICRIHRGCPSSRVLRREWDVEGALWLPGQPHALVFGEFEAYGTPMLALWDGGPLHQLVRTKDPELAGFEVWGLAADRRILIYSQIDDTPKGMIWRRYHVRLPRRGSQW